MQRQDKISVSAWWKKVEALCDILNTVMGQPTAPANLPDDPETRRTLAFYQKIYSSTTQDDKVKLQTAASIYLELAKLGHLFNDDLPPVSIRGESIKSLKGKMDTVRKGFSNNEPEQQVKIVGPLTYQLATDYLKLQEEFTEHRITATSFRWAALKADGFSTASKRCGFLRAAIKNGSQHNPADREEKHASVLTEPVAPAETKASTDNTQATATLEQASQAEEAARKAAAEAEQKAAAEAAARKEEERVAEAARQDAAFQAAREASRKETEKVQQEAEEEARALALKQEAKRQTESQSRPVTISGRSSTENAPAENKQLAPVPFVAQETDKALLCELLGFRKAKDAPSPIDLKPVDSDNAYLELKFNENIPFGMLLRLQMVMGDIQLSRFGKETKTNIANEIWGTKDDDKDQKITLKKMIDKNAYTILIPRENYDQFVELAGLNTQGLIDKLEMENNALMQKTSKYVTEEEPKEEKHTGVEHKKEQPKKETTIDFVKSVEEVLKKKKAKNSSKDDHFLRELIFSVKAGQKCIDVDTAESSINVKETMVLGLDNCVRHLPGITGKKLALLASVFIIAGGAGVLAFALTSDLSSSTKFALSCAGFGVSLAGSIGFAGIGGSLLYTKTQTAPRHELGRVHQTMIPPKPGNSS
ncbi:MAG TPA: hypothetical protein VLH77_07160 [Gammaproteobacteria bacterium]|nr:hypothetical protein [Gammaproteobacteria bacterium]